MDKAIILAVTPMCFPRPPDENTAPDHPDAVQMVQFLARQTVASEQPNESGVFRLLALQPAQGGGIEDTCGVIMNQCGVGPACRRVGRVVHAESAPNGQVLVATFVSVWGDMHDGWASAEIGTLQRANGLVDASGEVTLDTDVICTVLRMAAKLLLNFRQRQRELQEQRLSLGLASPAFK